MVLSLLIYRSYPADVLNSFFEMRLPLFITNSMFNKNAKNRELNLQYVKISIDKYEYIPLIEKYY